MKFLPHFYTSLVNDCAVKYGKKNEFFVLCNRNENFQWIYGEKKGLHLEL